MNLVLLDDAEVHEGRATLRDRRAAHLRDVLRASPGRRVRIGLLDGPTGTGTVTHLDAERVELACEFDGDEPSEPFEDTLVLAYPRPKVLARVLEHAAALGFARIVLTRTWRVDKSHLQSRVLEPETTRAHLVAGLEQGRHTRLPRVEQHPLFKPFVEDRLDQTVPPGARFVADGDAPVATTDLAIARPCAFTVAIGPERGFTPYEVTMFAERGFRPVRFPTGVLRVETAVAVAHAQLSLLRAIGTRGAVSPRAVGRAASAESE